MVKKNIARAFFSRGLSGKKARAASNVPDRTFLSHALPDGLVQPSLLLHQHENSIRLDRFIRVFFA